MIEQTKILEDHPDAPADRGHATLVQRRGVAVEQGDEAARRLQRKQDQAQKRRLPGAGRAGEELEALRLDPEAEIPQDLGPHPVAQSDILETNQAILPVTALRISAPELPTGPASDHALATDLYRRVLNLPLTITEAYGFVPDHCGSCTMLIVCPSCVSTYRMPPDAIRRQVTAIRCAQCGGIFQPATSVPAAAAPAWAPDGVAVAVLPAPRGLLPGVRAARPRPHARAAENPRSRGMIAAAALAMLLATGMAAVAQRGQIVALFPAGEAAFAAMGLPALPPELVLGGVTSALGAEGPAKVLTLQGTITNSRDTIADVPNLRIVVRDAAEQSLYSWVAPAPKARLAPGETMDFSSRLVSPPVNGHDLLVSFADRTDGAAPAKVKSIDEREATGPGSIRP